MQSINFITDEGEEIPFYIIEQTTLAGKDFLLVTDSDTDEDEAEVYIMQEISAVCDEIIIINEGKMIACDTPDNLTMHMASNGLHLVIKGDVPVIKGALRTVSGIKNVVYDEQIEEGTLGLTLYSIDKKDLREDVFFALAEAGCPILEMQSKKVSLEEIFLELTESEKKDKNPEKKNSGKPFFKTAADAENYLNEKDSGESEAEENGSDEEKEEE